MSTPTQHSKLSPSGSKRWMTCPGSVEMEADLPDTSSVYSAEGTAAHALLEWALEEEYHDLQDRLGETWEQDGFSGEVTEDMIDAVRVAVDYVRRRVGEARDESLGVEPELYLERRVNYEGLNPPEGLDGGTCDITLWYGPEHKSLEVIDYKHGAGVFVEVEDNTQALSYALGAVVTDRRRPDSVRTTIVQPRYHGGGDPVRFADYTWDDLVAFKRELFAAAEDTQDPDAPLVVGSHCRFCKAQAICPAQQSHAVELAQSEFDVIAQDPAVLTDPRVLTPEQVGLILDGAEHVEQWISALREYALEQIDRGVEIPGWKQVAGRANRRWTDEKRALNYLTRKKVPVDERAPRKPVSPAQAERALKRHGHDPSYISKYIEQPAGKPRLVPATHPSPALPASAQEDFAALTDAATTNPTE